MLRHTITRDFYASRVEVVIETIKDDLVRVLSYRRRRKNHTRFENVKHMIGATFRLHQITGDPPPVDSSHANAND